MDTPAITRTSPLGKLVNYRHTLLKDSSLLRTTSNDSYGHPAFTNIRYEYHAITRPPSLRTPRYYETPLHYGHPAITKPPSLRIPCYYETPFIMDTPLLRDPFITDTPLLRDPRNYETPLLGTHPFVMGNP